MKGFKSNFFAIFLLFVSVVWGQSPSILFYNGELTSDYYLWTWGFTKEPGEVEYMGYTPGTSAIKWEPYDQGGYQGIFIGRNTDNVDLSSIWETDSVYFMLRAPNGLDPQDPNLLIGLYDSRSSDWNYMVYYELTDFHVLDDGQWHRFSIALKDFVPYLNPIDKTDINAISFEYFDTGISSEFYIDKVWIGKPVVPVNLVLFNGQAVVPGVSFEAWGFDNNNLVIAEGEGYEEGSHAIVWETSNWDWQGMGFSFLPQDFSTCWETDSFHIKIKAPAGINDLAIVFYDENDNSARKVLDDISWDGTWKLIDIALKDFTQSEDFDPSTVYYISIEANDATIPERLLLTDIWTGHPSIKLDFVPPPAPSNIIADLSQPYVNLIAPEDIESETDETYTIYFSSEPITDLNDEDVYVLASGVKEGEVVAHNLYYPLKDSEVSYYYAATCTDAAGNTSESFYATETPFTNIGKARAIIHYGAPPQFNLDGYFDEWEGIMPFKIHPDRSLVVEGEVTDSIDYSLSCYLAMDNEYLYIAFDVFDDVFSWTPENTVDWWNDESIEFFIGFYPVKGAVSHHTNWQRGAEPDYRIVFRPDTMQIDAWPNVRLYPNGSETYFFESGGTSDYYIEAKIPLRDFAELGNDSLFVPQENVGIMMPIEIQANDADIQNGGTVARIQFGVNSPDSPWHGAPDNWTITWLGLPSFVGIEKESKNRVDFHLSNNYPNPFNPVTYIHYSIPYSGKVELNVYNSLGQKVRTIVNKYQTAGEYTFPFDASGLASGIYFYELKMRDHTLTKKMILLK